jgi:pimeloyl-ACP methyl ester carboxylesterase
VLARLLRKALLFQILLGALVGYWLAPSGASVWVVCLSAAIATPVMTALLAAFFTAVRSNPHEGALAWWRALLGETVATIKIFQLRQPVAHPTPGWLPPIKGALDRVPVLLVHGYMCNHRVWDDVASALRANGHAVLAINLEPLFTSIDAYVPVIEKAVEQLIHQSGIRQVALVGHSMGGLAIRAWMRAKGIHRVARVITLGTPHAGTMVGPAVKTPNYLQMRWQSTWLEQLAASELPVARSLMRIALTTHDNIVFPQRAQTLPGAQVTVFEGIGHLQLCTHPSVVHWLTTQLSDLH